MAVGSSAAKIEPTPIEVPKKENEREGVALARVAINPAVHAAKTQQKFVSGFGELEIADILAVLKEQTSAAEDGKTSRAEAMLAAQAHTLDAIFNSLASRAADNMGHYPETVERYLKLALRAQSQSRATWETLSTIKNPPMANYVGQANISNGPQQVNNGSSRTGKNKKAPIEQLEKKNASEWLESGKAGATGEVDKKLETVGAIDRTQK
jgi:hypothetical protein